MKKLILPLFTLLALGSYSQQQLKPIPQAELDTLNKAISGVEITLYEGTQTLSMSGLKNSRFIPESLDTVSPDHLNAKNDAYIMIMLNDDFYMSAEISYDSINPYMIVSKGNEKYHSKLTNKGTYFFKQLLKK